MGFFEIFAGALTALYAVIKSYGLSIILLTLLVRVILMPLSIKQTRSMREMQRIQPEVKKLQAKYKGNRQKMNEEMMKLYQEHKVNPFGGCLPLVLQFPVLIGLFYVLRTPLKYMAYKAPSGNGVAALVDFVADPKASGIMETLQKSALATDLHTIGLKVNQFLGLRLDCPPSAVMSGKSSGTIAEVCGSGFVSAIPYLALVLLMGLTTWYQQKQMQASQGQSGPQAQQMQLMGRILPIMLMVFSFNFPTGLVVYWLTTNVWTIVQQRIILRVAPPVAAGGPAPQKGDGRAKGTATGPPKQKAKAGGSSEEDSPPPKRRDPTAHRKKRKR